MTDHQDAITRVPLFRCPYCGHKTDAAAVTEGPAAAPEDGCPCGCMACGGPMMFHPDPLTGLLALHKMTREEADALTDDQRQQLARVQWFARHVYQPERARRN